MPLLSASADNISPLFVFNRHYVIQTKRRDETLIQVALAHITVVTKEVTRRHMAGKVVKIYTDSIVTTDATYL